MRFPDLRKWLAARSPSHGDAPGAAAPSPQDREAFDRLLADLTRRVPHDLREPFLGAVEALGEHPANGPALLDALDWTHVGLGVAIGRGQTGEGEHHEALGRVVAWLYDALGQPQDTEYAVVKRAAALLAARNDRPSD
jgi:hypothetical protein